VPQELALQEGEPLVAPLQRGRGLGLLLRPREHEGGVRRDRGRELEVGPAERRLLAAMVEVDEAGRGLRSEGHGEDGADLEAVGAAGSLEARLAADVGGEEGEPRLPHVPEHGQAERPFRRRALEVEAVGREGPPRAVGRRGEDAGPLRTQVRHERVEDPADHLAGVAGTEELARDVVERDEPLGGERPRGEGGRGIERRFGVGDALAVFVGAHRATMEGASAAVNVLEQGAE
jgi:hypothetical protein